MASFVQKMEGFIPDKNGLKEEVWNYKVFIAKENKKLKRSKPNENRNLLFGKHVEAQSSLRSGTRNHIYQLRDWDEGSVIYNKVLH